MKVSRGFYPVLNLFEVVFRNVCNRAIISELNDPDWIITEKRGFMDHNSLEKSKFFLKESVLNAERNISKSKCVVSSEKIAGELPFGFWTSLFDPHHFTLIKGSVLRAFPGKPADVNRRKLNQKLTLVREFRNRIYHNEPICFSGSAIDFSNAREIRRHIYEILEWIDPELPVYVDTFDDIEEHINSFVIAENGR
jgi:hypothetical protein